MIVDEKIDSPKNIPNAGQRINAEAQKQIDENRFNVINHGYIEKDDRRPAYGQNINK